MVEQDAESAATLALVTRFVESVGRRDLDAIMADMTGDAVYENLGHDVDSGRHEGQAAARAAFAAVTDDIFASGNRCCYCWTMRWTEPDGSEGTSRGTDIFTVRDGKISYKRTYE